MEKAFIKDNAFTIALQRELPFGGRERKSVKDITLPADLTKFPTLLYYI
jgi:hypothetical protein